MGHQGAPQGAVYVVEAPTKKTEDMKEFYHVKVAIVLGVLHIICGIVALSSGIAFSVIWHPINGLLFGGTWTCVFFFISGGLAIGGAQSGRRCLVVATMVMSIISAIFAGIAIILSALFLPWPNTLIGATMLILGITSASLTCRPLCRRSSKQGMVHHQPNQMHFQPNQVTSPMHSKPNHIDSQTHLQVHMVNMAATTTTQNAALNYPRQAQHPIWVQVNCLFF